MMAANYNTFVLTLFALMFCCLPMASRAASATATFYETYVPSACYGNKSLGVMIAAASNAFWQGGATCGRKYKVTCTGAAVPGTPNPCTSRLVMVKIADHCPHGCGSTIDLSKEAFATIVNPEAGIVEVTYFQYVQDKIS